jgi:hypothetical protein
MPPRIVRNYQDPYLELVRLVREASEIEHALLVQYLNAFFSVKSNHTEANVRLLNDHDLAVIGATLIRLGARRSSCGADTGPSCRSKQRAAETMRWRSCVTPNSNWDAVPGISRASTATAVLALSTVKAHSPSSEGSCDHEPRTPGAGSAGTPRPSAPVTTRLRASREKSRSVSGSIWSGLGTSMMMSAGSSRRVPRQIWVTRERKSSRLA